MNDPLKLAQLVRRRMDTELLPDLENGRTYAAATSAGNLAAILRQVAIELDAQHEH